MGCFPLRLACLVGGWLPAGLPHAADLLSEASPGPSPVPTGRHISPGPGTKAVDPVALGRWSPQPIHPDMKGRVLMALLGLSVALVAGVQGPVLKDFDFAKVAGLRAPAMGVWAAPCMLGRPSRTHSVRSPRSSAVWGVPGICRPLPHLEGWWACLGQLRPPPCDPSSQASGTRSPLLRSWSPRAQHRR